MNGAQDWIAIGPHGAYAACVSDPADKALVTSFKRAAKRRGHTVELASRDEACDRLRDYSRRAEAARIAHAAAMEIPARAAGVEVREVQP